MQFWRAENSFLRESINHYSLDEVFQLIESTDDSHRLRFNTTGGQELKFGQLANKTNSWFPIRSVAIIIFSLRFCFYFISWAVSASPAASTLHRR